MVGLSQSAPQISQQGVVSQVLGQLQPSIARTIAELLGGRTTSTVGLAEGATGAVRSSSNSFGQGATGSVSTRHLNKRLLTLLGALQVDLDREQLELFVLPPLDKEQLVL